MSVPEGLGNRLGDTSPGKFVKFFTRKKALSGEDFIPTTLSGGSQGLEGSPTEGPGRVSGVWNGGRDDRFAGPS